MREGRLQAMAGPLLAWYDENKRDLPWRGTGDPYRVWVSEIMLQQTRVAAVMPYYQRWMEELPTVEALAAVDEERLMKLWQGLGYYSRARNLQRAARMIVEEYRGRFPDRYEDLLRLPGVGDYTAGAIASIAFGLPCPAVDGNVLRVLSRVTASRRDIASPHVKKEMSQAIAAILPDRPGDFNQALMELGACVCLPGGEPLCGDCPVAGVCRARELGLVKELPVKAPKKPRRVEERTILVVRDEKGRIALRRRPSPGLLAGMWEPVNLFGRLDRGQVTDALLEMGLLVRSLQSLPDSRHIFSHVEWQMSGWEAKVTGTGKGEAGLRWVTGEELSRDCPLPSAFRVYL